MNCSNDNSQQSKESWAALQQPCFWLKSNDLMFSRDEHLFCSFHEFHMILVLRIFERQNFINGFTIMAKQQKQMNITTSLGEVKEFWPQISAVTRHGRWILHNALDRIFLKFSVFHFKWEIPTYIGYCWGVRQYDKIILFRDLHHHLIIDQK